MSSSVNNFDFNRIDYDPPKFAADGDDGQIHYRSSTGYNFSTLIFYEKYFFNEKFVHGLIDLVEQNRHFGTKLAVAYVVLIFALKQVMRDRERLSLRPLLVLWNVLLAAFSIIATFRTLPEIVHVIETRGLEFSLCNKDDFMYGVAGHWAFLFSMSKIAELVDTLFIVLRKQQLIFLHWYHHATILFYCYYWYADAPSTGRMFGGMNYCIHSIMYTYYALKAMRINLPKKLSLLITALQISQMLIGLWICLYVTYKKYFTTRECHTSSENIVQSYLMYFSYFLLFFNYFLQAYVFNKKKQTLTPKSSSSLKDDKKAN